LPSRKGEDWLSLDGGEGRGGRVHPGHLLVRNRRATVKSDEKRKKV